MKKSKDAKYFSLGHCANNMRRSYKATQRGEKPKQNLSEADEKRLDAIGFEWELSRKLRKKDVRCIDLLKFKAEYGHCRVSKAKSKDEKYYSLGNWVYHMRRSHRAIRKDEKPK